MMFTACLSRITYCRARSVRLIFVSVVLVLITVSLGGCGALNVGAVASATPTPTMDATAPKAWNAVAIAVPMNAATLQVTNTNYLTGHNTPFSAQKIRKPQFDGIAPDGQDLLYQISSSGHTMYYRARYLLPGSGYFFELSDPKAGNAIWMADSRHVLIATLNQGVISVDSQTGASTVVLPGLKNVRLVFYRADYLYVVGEDDRTNLTPSALYRVDIAAGASSNLVGVTQLHSAQASYWLSPSGSTVYFANKQGPTGVPGIYAVNSNGSNLRLLRLYTDGTPIGYAADGSLMIIRLQKGKFQVVRLGATQRQDQVMLADAAPGAASLCDTAEGGPDLVCDNDVALAPYGHALVMQATFANGTHRLWSDDLTTGKQSVLHIGPGADTAVQLLGWDRLPVR